MSTSGDASPATVVADVSGKDSASQLISAVDELLDDLSTKFTNVSTEIFAKMDEMTKRLDALEQSLTEADTGMDIPGNTNVGPTTQSQQATSNSSVTGLSRTTSPAPIVPPGVSAAATPMQVPQPSVVSTTSSTATGDAPSARTSTEAPIIATEALIEPTEA